MAALAAPIIFVSIQPSLMITVLNYRRYRFKSHHMENTLNPPLIRLQAGNLTPEPQTETEKENMELEKLHKSLGKLKSI